MYKVLGNFKYGGEYYTPGQQLDIDDEAIEKELLDLGRIELLGDETPAAPAEPEAPVVPEAPTPPAPETPAAPSQPETPPAAPAPETPVAGQPTATDIENDPDLQ